MYDEIYEVFKEVAEDNINRELFNHSKESAEDTIEDIKNNKLLIYTAFTGSYDSLKEPVSLFSSRCHIEKAGVQFLATDLLL